MKKIGKKGKIVSIVIIIVCVVGILTLGGFSIADDICYVEKIKNYDGEVKVASVDFIQPWLTESWEISDWEEHFDTLSEAGFDTLIWQFTRYGGVGASSVYYPTTRLSTVYDGEIYQDKTYMLERMFTAADTKGFKIFLGLSVDEGWWSFKQFADDEYLTAQAEIDNVMIEELYALYGGHSSFYGWYWAHEMLTNIHGYDIHWANMLNLTIAKLNEIDDGRPLLFSPFIHKIMRGTAKDSYDMWKNFFEIANLREGDIFCPQDSIGKINRGEVNAEDLAATYRYVKACKEAADEFEGIKFWVNCGLFATPSMFNETDLFTADLQRIIYQYNIASQFAEKVVTFSYSHYFAPVAETGSVEKHTDYCNFINSL